MIVLWLMMVYREFKIFPFKIPVFHVICLAQIPVLNLLVEKDNTVKTFSPYDPHILNDTLKHRSTCIGAALKYPPFRSKVLKTSTHG